MTDAPEPLLPATERPNPASSRLSDMDTAAILRLMGAEDRVALRAVDEATEALVLVAERLAACYLAGGRLVLLGAGTSGRIAVQEVAELPPTFGVEPDRFLAVAASRAPLGPAAIATTEDDTVAVAARLDELGVGPGDIVVGLAASGRTPFVCAGVSHARSRGAWTVGVAHNSPSELLRVAEHPVHLDTGPEVLTGSTRLKAGTAQKVALNRVTTAAMVRAGRVRGNVMTELRGTNAKLRDRAVRIVAQVTGRDVAEAAALLEAHDWHVGDTLRATEGGH